MALKFRVTSKEEVPPKQLPFCVERDGAWFLDVEGVADKAKFDEFRVNNLALMKARDKLKARFDGIDPAEVRRLNQGNNSVLRQAGSDAAGI